jgi:hypothetical protein
MRNELEILSITFIELRILPKVFCEKRVIRARIAIVTEIPEA